MTNGIPVRMVNFVGRDAHHQHAFSAFNATEAVACAEVNFSSYPETEVPGLFFFLVQLYSNKVFRAEILVRNSYA